jgi:hypothetical protein
MSAGMMEPTGFSCGRMSIPLCFCICQLKMAFGIVVS